MAFACLLVAVVSGAAAWWVWQAPTGSADVGLTVSQAIPSASPSPSPSSTVTTTSDPGGSGTGVTVARSQATISPAVVDPPVTLSVPSLGVSAEVVPVGVRADGAMEIPRDGASIGWYRWGPEPGDPTGSAVLSGHVSTRAGGPGALLRLAEAAPGDVLQVVTASGEQLAYRVVGVETITKSVLPVDRIFARDVPHRLTIVTCGGPFQPELGSYRDNVVVVAEPIVP